MLIDYAELVAVAQSLISATGRQVTFQRLSTTAADLTKPWNGTGSPTVQVSATLFATFVPATGSGFGREFVSEEMLKRVEQVCLVAPNANNMSTFNTIVDGATWGIEWVYELKPGATTLLWAIGVKQ